MIPKDKTPPDKNKIKEKYANYFKVGYNAYEFIIDFCRYYPENDCYSENEKAKLCERIITSPVYAKVLMNILMKSIKEYEDTLGLIEEDENGSKLIK
jgi:hypothetical protein